ncbi:hypothetical protein [Vibrio fluvialis]|uniref:hypothetical protein n=1 Tax=Vibrio fluvialis TaxID=676 RepID=UPI003999D901
MDDKAKKRAAATKRKREQRNRDKAEGTKEARIPLSAVEWERLEILLAGRAPGRKPYEVGDYLALLIDRDWKKYQEQIGQLSSQRCGKCQSTLPGGCGGLFTGDAECALHIKQSIHKELSL